jgi:O-antigen/teichoic acid export membrane protein
MCPSAHVKVATVKMKAAAVEDENYSFAGTSLKTRTVRAGGWAIFGYVAALVLRLSSNLILSRLLAPEAFGIMAVASVFQIITTLLSDLGIRQAIMQSANGEDESFLNTAWSIQVCRGVFVWGACVLAAVSLHIAQGRGLFAPDTVYVNSDLPIVIAVVSFASVISGFHSMKAVVLNRNLHLRPNTFIEVVQMLAGLCVAIGFGWLTRSVWAFVASGITGPLVTVLLSRYWLPGRKDRFEWNRKAVAELVRFGRWILLSSAISVAAMNGDRLMLAAWTTPTILGYFSIASNLSTVVESIANRIFGSVAMPALSEIARHQPYRFPEVYFRMRWLSDPLFIFISGGLFAAGGGIVKLLFDARYAPAGEMLHWLSLSLIFSRYGLAQNAYVALGRPNYITVINFAKVISLFTIVPTLFYFFGIEGAIIGLAIQLFPIVPIIFWFNRKHHLNNIKLEIAVLAIWPFGWLVGEIGLIALRL